MPEFILDTSGAVLETREAYMPRILWKHLDAFTQGYIEALFFTETAPGVSTEEWQATEDHDEGSIPDDVAFADLAPASLATIIEDCRAFQEANAEALEAAYSSEAVAYDEAHAGHDYWLTRNGHGAGFWDRGLGAIGDTLSAAARYSEVYVCLGDDGRVYTA